MKLRGFARLALMIIPVAGAAVPMALFHVATAAGTTIVVGSFDDPTTATDCTGAANGTATCTLRAAVQQANSDNAGDIVQLGVGTYTLKQNASAGNGDSGSLGDLEVVFGMTIQGAGPTQTIIQGVGPDVSTTWNDRIIEVADEGSSPPSVAISGLTVTGGAANAAAANPAEADGGGILSASANLTLNNVVVDGNTSDANGGGIASESGSTFNMSHSTLSNNNATGNGGGLFLGGNNNVSQTFSNLFITGNTAQGNSLGDSGGGGIYDDLTGTGDTTFTDLMVTGNHATGMSGGGIYENSQINRAGTINSLYRNITISGNDSVYAGGGIYAARTVTGLTNATITGNAVTGQVSANNVGGGGIAAGASAQLTVNNATINRNTSTAQGGGIAAVDSNDHVHLHNSILVNNTVNSAVIECFKNAANVIDSTGYNIVDDLTCALVPVTDRQGSSFNPNLGPLKDNTGPLDGATGAASATLTEALPKGSIAIDTADPAGANNPATDERGVSRPQGPQSDVGAYEAVPPVFVAPVLPAAGHPPAGNPAAPLALLIPIAAAAVGAAGLRMCTKVEES